MRKLYEIRADIQAAVDSMISGEESVGAVDLEELEIEATEKIRNCFFAVNKLRGEVAEADIIIEQAQSWAKKRKEAISRIEADMKITMEVMGLKKIDDPDCRVTLGAPSAKVDVFDESKIPETYTRTVPAKIEPDKKAILDALKNGAEIPGCAMIYGEPRLTYPKIKGE